MTQNKRLLTALTHGGATTLVAGVVLFLIGARQAGFGDDSPLTTTLGVVGMIVAIIGACSAVVGGFGLLVRSGRSIGLMSWLLIPVGVALDFALAALNNVLKLPLFLDSVGHILAGLLGGPIVGGLTGFLGVLTNSAFQPSAIVWCFQGATIGILVGLLAQWKMFKGVGRSVISTLIVIVTSIVMSSVISIIVYGGIDTYTSSALVVFFQKIGFGLVPAVVIKSTIVEFVDKIISVGLPLIVVVAMSSRLLNQFVTGPKLRELKTEAASEVAANEAVDDSYGSYGEQ